MEGGGLLLGGGRMEKLVARLPTRLPTRLPRPTRKMLRQKPQKLGQWREAVAK